MQQQRFPLIACNVKAQIEASPSKRILLGPFSSPWLLVFATMFSLASTEHLLYGLNPVRQALSFPCSSPIVSSPLLLYPSFEFPCWLEQGTPSWLLRSNIDAVPSFSFTFCPSSLILSVWCPLFFKSCGSEKLCGNLSLEKSAWKASRP